MDMKLTFQGQPIQTSENFNSSKFGIRQEDMGIVLDILRSKMYKNPIAAVCREISSNARDANREVGNDHIPIEISFDELLFQTGSLCINFTDCGPGISPERMNDIFINYGASTKRSSNNFTGGFGLGAKTPFALNIDNFFIITKYNGIKYSYVAAIEDTKTGGIYLLNEEPTTEANGTTISIPIEENDRFKFEEELYLATMFWNPLPKFINFSKIMEQQVKFVEKYDVNIVDKKNLPVKLNDLFYLLIDGIIYPIDSSKISNTGSYSAPYIYLIKFNNGDLPLSANRENIIYDSERLTVKKIENKMSLFKQNLRQEISEEINKCSNYLQAIIVYKDKYSQIDRNCNLFKNDLFYKDKCVNLTTFFGSLDTVIIYEYEKNADRISISNVSNEWLSTPFYYNLSSTVSARKKERIFQDNKKFFVIVPVSHNLKNFSKQKYSFKKKYVKNMRKFISQLQEFNSFVNLKNIQDVQPLKVNKEKVDLPEKRITVRNIYDGGFRMFTYDWSEFFQKRISSTDLYYVFTQKDRESTVFKENMLKAEFLSRFCSINIWFVNAKHQWMFEKQGIELLTKFINDKKFFQQKQIKSCMYNYLIKDIDENFLINCEKINIFDGKNVLKQYKNSNQIYSVRSNYIPYKFHNLIENEFLPKYIDLIKFKEQYLNILKEYPVLKLLDGALTDNEVIVDLKNYYTWKRSLKCHTI
jgi:hypothetical protein